MTETTDPVEDAAHALEKSIRTEMDSIVTDIQSLAARCRRLGVGARAINGLSKETAVWSRDLEVIADKVNEEAPEVTKALLGKDPVPMTEIVNHELAHAVASDTRRNK